MNIFKTCK